MKVVARTTKAPIKAIVDNVPHDDAIDPLNPLTLDAPGTSPINHTGETTPHYGLAEPQMRYGEALYVCRDGELHLAGDLEAHGPDGRVQPIEGQVTPRPLTALRSVAEQRLRALEYASWIAHSRHEFERGQIDQITRDRVEKRARDYAEAAGATAALEAILAALKP